MRAVAAPRASAARPARAARDATTRRRVVAGASRYALCAHGENLPHPDKTAKGGEDAWFARVSAANGGGALGVADGVGGFNDQGVDPGLYARVLSYEGLRACDGGDGGFFGSCLLYTSPSPRDS